jgi:hypothetical protein
MSRRALRLDRCVVSTTVLVYALAPHAAYWAHHNGFLSQTLGVSGLLLGLAALASAGGISRRTGLVTFSLAAAFLYVVYLPFLILLGAAAAVHAVAEAARVRRDKRLSVALRGWTWALVLPLALVGLDLTPLIRGLPNLLGSGAVGGHIPLDVAGFAAVALGPGPGAWAGWPRWTVPGTGLLALAAALLATKGTRALGRGRRGLGVLTVAAVLAGLLLVCGGFSRDPWTGQRGQTWFIFKTVQWLFPVALLLEAAGLSSIRRHRKGVAMVMLTAAASLVPAHLPWSRALATAMKDILGGNRPLAELPDVLRHFRELPEGRLVLLGLPERVSDFRGHYAALLSWPRPLAVDWEGNASLRVLKRIDAQDVIALLAEAPPFDREDRVDLGARFARLTALERPRLVQLVARLPAVGVAHTEGLVVPLARSRTKLLVLAPRGGPVELELRFEPSAGARTSVVRCQIIPGAAGGPSYRRVVRLTPPRLLRVVRGVANVVRFDAEPGLNAVVLVPDGAPQRLLNVAVREGSTTTKPPVP